MKGLARFLRTPQSLPDALSLTLSSRLGACPEPVEGRSLALGYEDLNDHGESRADALWSAGR